MTTPDFPPPSPFPPHPGFPNYGGPQPPPWTPAGKPAVLKWFAAYCVFMTLLYAACVAGGAWVLTLPEDAMTSREVDATEMRIQGGVLLAIALPLMVAFGLALVLPRRRWVWIYNLVLIAVGLTSVCCLPVTVPLLIYFIKPETKAWFDAPRA